MAFNSANFLNENGMPPGFAKYIYHTTDAGDVVEDAGYLNNKDDELNLAKGDRVTSVTWNSAVLTGTINEVKEFIVTNVISNDAANDAGNVNLAEYLGGGAVSSGD